MGSIAKAYKEAATLGEEILMLREENPRLKNENQFYLRKMKKMKKKMKEMEEESKVDKEFQEEVVQENKRLEEEVNDRVVIEDIAECFGSDEGDDFDWECEIYGIVQENKKLKEELKAYEKSARNSGEIELRQEEEIKKLKLELKAAQEVSVVYMKRYEQKADEERQIDEICGRIKCEDTLGHLIGKVPRK